MKDEFLTIFIILNDRYIFGIVSTSVESTPLSLTENIHLSFKTFLISRLNLLFVSLMYYLHIYITFTLRIVV